MIDVRGMFGLRFAQTSQPQILGQQNVGLATCHQAITYTETPDFFLPYVYACRNDLAKLCSFMI